MQDGGIRPAEAFHVLLRSKLVGKAFCRDFLLSEDGGDLLHLLAGTFERFQHSFHGTSLQTGNVALCPLGLIGAFGRSHLVPDVIVQIVSDAAVEYGLLVVAMGCITIPSNEVSGAGETIDIEFLRHQAVSTIVIKRLQRHLVQ